MTTGRRRAGRLAVYAGMALLLVLFARQVDWRAAARSAGEADLPLLLLAAFLSLASLALKGVRWWVFLRPLGVRSLGLVMRATFAGASLNNLLIAQGGEGARVLLVSRSANISSAGVLAALALERALDALSYLALLVGAAWLLPLPEVVARWRAAATLTLAVATLALALAVSRPRTLAGASTAPVGRVRAYFRRVGTGLGEIASPRRLGVGMALSAVAWALQVATYHLVALAAHASLPIAGSVAALLAVGISFLVRATPGNVGVFQLVYAVTVRSFGIADGPAVAIAGLIQLVQVVPVVVIGTLVTRGPDGRAA